MVIKENITLNGRECTRTYSDTYTIQRDGVEYDEAIDPINSGRVYTETTNVKNGVDEISDSEFVEMLEAVL